MLTRHRLFSIVCSIANVLANAPRVACSQLSGSPTAPQELFTKFFIGGKGGRSHGPAQRLGWLLFLAAKRKLLPEMPDIVRCGTHMHF